MAGTGNRCKTVRLTGLLESATGPYATAGPGPHCAGSAGVEDEADEAAMQRDGRGSGWGSDDPRARMRCSARLAGGTRSRAETDEPLAGTGGGCEATAVAAGTEAQAEAVAEAGRAGKEDAEEEASTAVDSDADTRLISSWRRARRRRRCSVTDRATRKDMRS